MRRHRGQACLEAEEAEANRRKEETVAVPAMVVTAAVVYPDIEGFCSRGE